MAIKVQGSQLWFNDPNAGATEVGCVTALNPGSSPRSQINTTCITADAETFLAGIQQSGTATFGINFDPSDESHTRLEEIRSLGTVIDWALGWSDGTEAATAESNGDFDLPDSRTFTIFSGYISELTLDFAINDVVKSVVSIQLSGERVTFPKQTS